MPNTLRNIRLRDAMRQPSALGWHNIIFIALFPFVVGLGSEAPPSLRISLPIHLYDFLGGFGIALALVMARLVAKRRKYLSSRAAYNITAWFVAGTFGLLLQDGAAALAGPLPQLYIDAAPITLITALGQLLSFHLFSMGFIQLRTVARQVSSLDAQLASIRGNLEQQVTQARHEVADRVQQVIMPLLDSVRGSLADLADKRNYSAGFATEILSQIDSTVRPLSHQLTEPITPAATEQSSIKPSPLAVWKTALTRSLPANSFVNTSFWVLFSLIFISPAYLIVFSSISAFAASIVTVAAIAIAANRLSNALAKRKTGSIPQFGLAIASAGIIAAALLTATTIADPGIHNSEFVGVGNYMALGEFIVTLVSSIHSVILAGRWSALAARRTATDSLKKLILRLQVERDLQARRLAHLVHGRVQATLQSIAFKLNSTAEPTADSLAQISQQLDAVAAELKTEAPTTTELLPALEQLRDLWDGICDIELALADEAMARLHASPQAAHSTLVVAEEAVTNAFKHGRADAARIEIALANDKEVRLLVTHESLATVVGAGETAPRKPDAGFGSTTYDALTVTWELNVGATEATLEATIALEA